VGLDRQQVLDALRDRTYLPDVEADIEQAITYGISGVPYYVIDGRYGVSGAQAPDTFAQALARV
jgi:predicted DsbA family dithiol-disulfide isomerase